MQGMLLLLQKLDVQDPALVNRKALLIQDVNAELVHMANIIERAWLSYRFRQTLRSAGEAQVVSPSSAY